MKLIIAIAGGKGEYERHNSMVFISFAGNYIFSISLSSQSLYI